jgi:hypothetical protein
MATRTRIRVVAVRTQARVVIPAEVVIPLAEVIPAVVAATMTT